MQARSVFKVLLAVVLIVGVPLYYVISQSIEGLCSADPPGALPETDFSQTTRLRVFADLLETDSLYRFERNGKWCPSIRDIALPSALFGLSFIGARFIALSLFSPLGRYLIPHSRKTSPQIYTAKVTRFCHNAFKTLYFVAISTYAYNVLQKEPFFPAEFGGPGSQIASPAALDAGAMSPAAKLFVRNYFTLSCGFQLASVYFLLTEPFFADFWESMVQVALALELILFGYLGNFFAAGAILLLVHDSCDILTSLCKALVDTTCKVTTFMAAVLLIASWGYTRLFCVAKLVLFPALSQLPFEGAAALESVFFAILLLCLFFMNIYWFSLMARSCAIFVSSGRIMDAHAPRLRHQTSIDSPCISRSSSAGDIARKLSLGQKSPIHRE